MPNVKATKALQKRSDQAFDALNQYYAAVWGEERWQNELLPALCKPTRYCAVINQYGDPAEANTMIHGNEPSDCDVLDLDTSTSLNRAPIVLVKTSDEPFPVPKAIGSASSQPRLFSHWNMDAASVLAAHTLGVQPGDRVLDLCAAPGGKSVVLAQILWPELHVDRLPEADVDSNRARSVLHANESDKMRHARLASNLKSYLPQTLLTDNSVKVLCIDGSEKSAAADLPLGEGGYDKVLLDAPCSSERHIIHAHVKASSGGQIAGEMSNWKSSHSKTLARIQVALLMTALRAVKIGGTILYATCSISQEENDDVIDRALDALRRERKKSHDTSSGWKVKVDNNSGEATQAKNLIDTMTEATKYGRIALPDHVTGERWGPLYFCVLRKVPSRSTTTSKGVPSTIQAVDSHSTTMS